MRIITISGHAGSGKDTAANQMKPAMESEGKKVLIAHYADLLKYICKMFLGWDGNKDEAGRNMLQRIGTDIIRNKNPNYWVDFVEFVIESLYEYGKWDYVIIPDARFPNEISRLTEDGFSVTHVRIVRDKDTGILNKAQKNHASETSLNEVIPDFILKNYGTKEDFEKKIIKWTKEFIV